MELGIQKGWILWHVNWISVFKKSLPILPLDSYVEKTRFLYGGVWESNIFLFLFSIPNTWVGGGRRAKESGATCQLTAIWVQEHLQVASAVDVLQKAAHTQHPSCDLKEGQGSGPFSTTLCEVSVSALRKSLVSPGSPRGLVTMPSLIELVWDRAWESAFFTGSWVDNADWCHCSTEHTLSREAPGNR